MTKAILPGANEPVVLNGGLINPVWYAFFFTLMKSGLMDLSDVLKATPSDGQFLTYKTASGKWTLQPETPPSITGQVATWDNVNKKWVMGSN